MTIEEQLATLTTRIEALEARRTGDQLIDLAATAREIGVAVKTLRNWIATPHLARLHGLNHLLLKCGRNWRSTPRRCATWRENHTRDGVAGLRHTPRPATTPRSRA